jgi:hypothetical protein
MKARAFSEIPRRSFYEADVAFCSSDGALLKIMSAYVHAAASASMSAQMLVLGETTLARAQWDEAVASTLERVLAAFPHTSGETGPKFDCDDFIELPGPPERLS